MDDLLQGRLNMKKIETLQQLKDEITQTKGFQRLTAEQQFEVLNSNVLQDLFKICAEIILVN